MAITINVSRINKANLINDEGLTLAVLTKVEPVGEEVARVTQIDELYTNFKLPKEKVINTVTVTEYNAADPEDRTDTPVPEDYNTWKEIGHIYKDGTDYYQVALNPNLAPANYQLLSTEYMLRAGTNLVVFTGEIEATDTDTNNLKILLDQYGFKQIVVPYENIEDNTVKNLAKIVDDKEVSVQLFVDTNPETDIDNLETKLGDLRQSTLHLAKTEVCINSGLPLFSPYGNLDIPDDFEEGYYGIPASIILASAKANMLLEETPWIPVAGEAQLVTTVGKLHKNFNLFEKEDIQALNINLLLSKVGIGNLFVSQNTQFKTNNRREPLLRSHVVTEALWIKRRLDRLGTRFEWVPNNDKFRNSLRLALRSFFDDLTDKDAIIGRANIIITGEDTEMRGLIEYVPVRVTESIVLNLNILDDTGDISVSIEGGNL